VATLETPTKIRELQRALYLRSKQEPRFRFYALYDKVWRGDFLAHAYALARANDGAPGPDGMTFADIEATGSAGLIETLQEELRTKRYRPGPVRRVYIPKANGGERPLGIPNIRDRVVQTAAKLVLEPIFEADFDDDSFGFRPKRDAHQALTELRQAIEGGMCWVLDADVTAYFDTIPHDRLMKAVARRVVDGAMLALIKSFLMAPVIDEREDDRPRRNRQGTPQGGVISPLLANIYLDLLDRNFRRHVAEGSLTGRLIRYADDFVLVAAREPVCEQRWVNNLLTRLGLQLHPEKTRVLDVRQQEMDFLGHTLRWRRGRVYFDISRKARSRIRTELRHKTRQTWQTTPDLIADLNEYIRGARSYYKLVLRRTLAKLDHFVHGRLARWWGRRHALPGPAWWLVRTGQLWRQHGLTLERWHTPWASRSTPARTAP
jgi:RNA-directed DNA polymerase